MSRSSQYSVGIWTALLIIQMASRLVAVIMSQSKSTFSACPIDPNGRERLLQSLQGKPRDVDIVDLAGRLVELHCLITSRRFAY